MLVVNDTWVHKPYWDVFPKSIRASLSEDPQDIPLSIRGQVTAPMFESSNPDVMSVDTDGVLHVGDLEGNAMILVWDSAQKTSLRHVAVEVRDPFWFETHPDFTGKEMAHISGNVIDATTTDPVPDVSIVFRRSETGTVEAQTTSDMTGHYEADLMVGLHYYEVSADGYFESSGWIEVQEGGGTHNLLISPILVGAASRIVLEWGENPTDLDAHLRGPLPTGDRFHVFYAHKVEADCAELDVDDVSSYGPETITILNYTDGIYRYYVHDFSNAYASPDYPSYELANSGATAKVFTDTGDQITFNVPYQDGTVWYVMDIDGATGQVTPVNEMFYEEDSRDVGE